MKNKYRRCTDVVNKLNRYMNFGLLLLTVVVLVSINTASATPRYVSTLKNVYGNGSCGTCHVNSSGGGERNAYGTLFEQQMSHVASPSAALVLIGSPSNIRNTTAISTQNVTTPNMTTQSQTINVTKGPTTTLIETPTVTTPQKAETVVDVTSTPIPVATNKSPGIGIVVAIGIIGTMYVIRRRK
jgi:hypothetical protein